MTGECSVVLYGDSILHGGYGGHLRLAEPPAATLRRLRPKYTVEDRTVNGETATDRAKAFGTEQRTAHFVVIAHGINDVARNLNLEGALREMVSSARAEGREVILTGLSRQSMPLRGRAEGDAAIRKVAKDMKVTFADWGSVRYAPSEMADFLHPGKAYSDRLMERVVGELDAAAPGCAN